MAHIVDFTIEGLAGRKGVYKQRFNRDINVFFGPNGSGKTSLLRFLDSAMEGVASRIMMVPFKTAEVTIFSVDWDREFVRRIRKPDKITKPPRVRKGIVPRHISATTDVGERVYYKYMPDAGMPQYNPCLFL